MKWIMLLLLFQAGMYAFFGFNAETIEDQRHYGLKCLLVLILANQVITNGMLGERK